MSKLKTIGMVLMLIVLTFGMVFLPQWIRERSESAILERTETRIFHTESRAKLSAEQIARLYCDHQISVEYPYDPSGSSTRTDASLADKKQVCTLLDKILGENEAFSTQLKNALNNDTLTECLRWSTLIKIEDQPFALNFVLLGAAKGDLFFEILYEEKTETIFQLSADVNDTAYGVPEQSDYLFEQTQRLVDAYYQNELRLNTEDYYYLTDIPKGSGFLVHIGVGLVQSSNKIDAEEVIQF